MLTGFSGYSTSNAIANLQVALLKAVESNSETKPELSARKILLKDACSGLRWRSGGVKPRSADALPVSALLES